MLNYTVIHNSQTVEHMNARDGYEPLVQSARMTSILAMLLQIARFPLSSPLVAVRV